MCTQITINEGTFNKLHQVETLFVCTEMRLIIFWKKYCQTFDIMDPYSKENKTKRLKKTINKKNNATLKVRKAAAIS